MTQGSPESTGHGPAEQLAFVSSSAEALEWSWCVKCHGL